MAGANATLGASLATFGLTQLISNVARKLTPDQTPFSFAKLDFFKGRGGDNEATYNKLMEAGFSGEDSLMDIFGDTVRTMQDYYEFRDKYFVGDFETVTFRKDLEAAGLAEDFYPAEEPAFEMMGILNYT